MGFLGLACGNHDWGNDASGDAATELPPTFGDAALGEAGKTGDEKCSDDQRHVVDSKGNPIQTCTQDEQCALGACVPACEAAKLNNSTIGCDYYAVDPGSMFGEAGSCFAAYVANTWTTDIGVEVTYDGKTLDLAGLARIPSGSGANITYAPLPNGKIPAGSMAILFLADWKTSTGFQVTHCPAGITPGFTAAEASSQYTGIYKAFHVTTSAPVVAYDIFPYGGKESYISSATLLVPTSAWDTNYVAVDGYAPPPAPQAGEPFIQIVAWQPNTQVTISPTAAIVGGLDVPATGKGVPRTYDLSPGDVLQLKQHDELNGSPILSNVPVGVWGGHSCMDIETGNGDCDSAHQQLFPVKAMGSEYAAVKHKNRIGFNEKPPYRIVGAVDGTTLTYDPPIAGAPTTLSQGQLVKFSTTSDFVVKSQDAAHPFYIGAHMMGVYSQGQSFGVGDPDWVNVIPGEQWLPKYVFFTDPTMSETNLVVVRKKASDGTFKDVKLDCMSGNVTGFAPIGSSGAYESARVDLVTAGAKVGACDNGLHEMHSEEPFGLTVWGYDFAVSYAYPAGARVKPLNTVVVPPTPK